jgi:hypothetical protein
MQCVNHRAFPRRASLLVAERQAAHLSTSAATATLSVTESAASSSEPRLLLVGPKAFPESRFRS